MNGARAQDRSRRAPRGRRARVGDALDRRSGQGRAGARVEAGGPARVRRGGRGAREVQATAAPRRAQARARRGAGRTRARTSRRRCGSACDLSRSRRLRPSAPRSSRSRSRRCARGSPSSIWRKRVGAEARSRVDATTPHSRGAAPSRGSKDCWPTVREPRTSSRMPRAGARRRWPRSTGCRGAASASTLRNEAACALRDRLARELARTRADRGGRDGQSACARARGC